MDKRSKKLIREEGRENGRYLGIRAFDVACVNRCKLLCDTVGC